jgi:hypothetical protein
MARRKTPPDLLLTKSSLAERLRQLRAELYGERGGPEMARRLDLPVRTWYNYETGVTVPAEVVLRIIELTAVEPMWLLHGEGPKFRAAVDRRPEPVAGSGQSVGALLRAALQILEQGDRGGRTNGTSVRAVEGMIESRHAADGPDVVLVSVEDSQHEPLTALSGPRYLAARTEWLDAQRDCRCIRVVGEAMAPIVADGAYVAFAESEEDPAELDGTIVVTWRDDQPLVRWFQHCGRYALLRAENPATEPAQFLVDLQGQPLDRRFRRVLWINTPH